MSTVISFKKLCALKLTKHLNIQQLLVAKLGSLQVLKLNQTTLLLVGPSVGSLAPKIFIAISYCINSYNVDKVPLFGYVAFHSRVGKKMGHQETLL